VHIAHIIKFIKKVHHLFFIANAQMDLEIRNEKVKQKAGAIDDIEMTQSSKCQNNKKFKWFATRQPIKLNRIDQYSRD
jgi:hypothetical protein